MRIALIIRGLDRMGGVQRHVLEVARGLRARGHEAVIYTLAHTPSALYPELRDAAPVVVASDAVALAALIDPATDVLNPHDRAYDVAYHFKKKRAVPSVWTMHDMPTRAFSSMRAAACAGTTVGFLRRIINAVHDRREVLPYVRAQDTIAVLDERDKAWVRMHFNKGATVIRNGVDPLAFTYTPHAVQVPLHLLMAGICFPHRRFEDGIEAARLLRERGIDAVVDIVGSFNPQDPYYRSLQKPNWVTFHGAVSEEELRRFYRGSSVFIFPNHLQSWGLAVFEALGSGLPTVVSRSAGASEVLTHGQTALLVNPLSPVQIADALEALAGDPALYGRLSAQGRAFVEGNLRWDTMVTQMEALLRSASATYGH